MRVPSLVNGAITFLPNVAGNKSVNGVASLSEYTPKLTEPSKSLIIPIGWSLPVPATIPCSKAIATDSDNMARTNLSNQTGPKSNIDFDTGINADNL